jgi:hypothetical protein
MAESGEKGAAGMAYFPTAAFEVRMIQRVQCHVEHVTISGVGGRGGSNNEQAFGLGSEN